MEMSMKLIRGKGNAKSIEGKLYIDGVFECYTVEDTDRQLEKGGGKIQDKTAIPRGTYIVGWSFSSHFKKWMPIVLNVPQFEGVRIHAGNSDVDTEGCIIVGAVNDVEGDDWISASKVAVDRLYPKIESAVKAGKKVNLEIV
jgi:hypothetical protein